MTTADETATNATHERCGCCGRHFERRDVVELGSTAGVFICVGCALYAARRAGPRAAIRQLRLTKAGSRLQQLTTALRARARG